MPQKQPNLFLKYSNLAIQMAVIIGLSAWAGQKADTYFKLITPVFTIILSLLGIAASMYLIFRDLLNNKD